MSEQTSPVLSKRQHLFLPAGGGTLFVLMLCFFLFFRPYALLGDGGTCRHMLTGEYILKHASIPTTNYLSAFDANAPWVTHELVGDLIFAPYYIFGGLNWVILTSALAVVTSIIWAYQIGRARGLGPVLGLGMLAVAVEACSIHWSARPHLFTYLTFVAAYYYIFVSNAAYRVRLTAVTLVLLLWGNLHGSFFLGLLLLVCRLVGDLIEVVDKKLAPQSVSTDEALVDGGGANLRQSLVMLLAAGLASCLNLRGVQLFGYLTSPAIRMNSDEWRSIDFSFMAPALAFLLLFALLAAIWVYSEKKPRAGEFLAAGLMFCASVYAMRLFPYFVLLALPAAGPQWAAICKASLPPRAKNWLSGLAQREERLNPQEEQVAKLMPVWLLVSFLVSLAFLLLPLVRINDFDPTRLPVAAVTKLQEKNIDGVGFCRDNWGDYLYWRTRKPIFIDDKTDFYPPQRLDDYASIYMTYPGWQTTLQKYDFKYMLLPRGLPLTFLLKDNPAWVKCHEDEVAVLYLKK